MQCSLMLATSTAATGTSVTTWPVAASSVRNQGPFVLAEELFDAPQRDRIDVPGVAGNVGDLVDTAIVRRMEPMVHARGQPQRHEAAVAVGVD